MTRTCEPPESGWNNAFDKIIKAVMKWHKDPTSLIFGGKFLPYVFRPFIHPFIHSSLTVPCWLLVPLGPLYNDHIKQALLEAPFRSLLFFLSKCCCCCCWWLLFLSQFSSVCKSCGHTLNLDLFYAPVYFGFRKAHWKKIWLVRVQN
jgi:hypothetical protein